MMRTLTVTSSRHTYPLFMGEGVFNTREFQAALKNPERIWVTHASLLPLLTPIYQALSLRSDLETVLLIPEGESYKTLKTWEDLLAQMLAYRFSRNSILIALGGGVVSDLSGFASACYLRGISYITVPTTLLAMVDASVGGKTGVNHPLGKNLIGAFYPPSGVFIHPQYLKTLPEREWRSGLAEVVKYGFIFDKNFLIQLSGWLPEIEARDPRVLCEILFRCCEIKAQIVAQDERDQGMRMILNFGHTLGHALENAAGYGELLHGEAVSIGMCYALDLSVREGFLSKTEAAFGQALLKKLGLPTEIPPEISRDKIVEALCLDKKHTASGYRLILLEKLGMAREWVCDIDGVFI